LGEERFLHPDELACLEAYLDDGLCCAAIGLSNTGKSVLLRTLCAPREPPFLIRGEPALLLYVDCNQMVDLSEQGFYEVVLRTARSRLEGLKEEVEVRKAVEEAYRRVVEPPNPFAVPVGFAEGMERLCEGVVRPLVVMLDEFDEPFAALEGRVFLNLRALRDRYSSRLVYVLGLERTPDEIRRDEGTAEFRELFAGHICRLGMLPGPRVSRWVRMLAAEEGVDLTDEEVAFVLEQAGGHPGLVQAVTRLLVRARTLAPETYTRMGTDLVAKAVPGDPRVRAESERLWSHLRPEEQEVFHRQVMGDNVGEEALERLVTLGLTDEEGQPFGAAFAAFVRRQAGRRVDLPPGIWLDEATGEVYVDGRPTPLLTDLEFRLLRALYGRKGQLCDRYYLVKTVWGEEYIDQVDDARIEKLVSRLRAKIEPDPTHPRYLVTVRGRGYRLRHRWGG